MAACQSNLNLPAALRPEVCQDKAGGGKCACVRVYVCACIVVWGSRADESPKMSGRL